MLSSACYGLSFKNYKGNSCIRYYSSEESRDRDLALVLKFSTNTDVFSFNEMPLSLADEFVICA